MNFFNDSLSALKTITTGQDITASNIANINTTGYKEKTALQSGVKGGGVKTSAIRENFQAGTFKFTGEKFDIAVSGGFLALQSAEEKNYYSSGGSFFKDAAGNIVNNNGLKLQPPITLSPDEDIVFSNDGGYLIIDSKGDAVKEGRLEVYSFNNNEGLKNEGGGLYSQTPASGRAVRGNFKISQGALEMSNVDLASQMTRSIINENSFKLQISVIKTKDDMLKDILEIKG